MNSRITRFVAVIGVAIILLGSLTALAGQTHELESEHFVISYTTSGPDTVDMSYVTTVRDTFEEAYRMLVDRYGFSIPYGKIEVNIFSGDSGELGSEYMDTTDPSNLAPMIAISTQAEMWDSIASMYVRLTVEGLVRSTAAHELFHVVQDSLALAGENDMSDQPFVEPLAVWAQEQVFPDVNDYLEDGLDFLLAPDSIDFFYRTYDAGIFWVFLSSHHGGVDAIKRVLAESASYEGRYAIDAAFRDRGVTFDDLWEEFAIAAGVGDLPDHDVILGLFHSQAGKEKVKGHETAASNALPVSTYEEVWNGGELVIDRSNAENVPPYELLHADDPAGRPLRVAHAYGIDYLRLRASTQKTMTISFAGDAGTAFRADVVLATGETYTVHSLVEGTPVAVESPDSYDEICIVVTRGEAGTGTYSLKIEEGE